MLFTTTDFIQGKTIVDYYGMVSGTASLNVSMALTQKGAQKAIDKFVTEAEKMAFSIMEKKAKALGANAVIAVRCDFEPTANSTRTLLFASGTAVKIE